MLQDSWEHGPDPRPPDTKPCVCRCGQSIHRCLAEDVAAAPSKSQQQQKEAARPLSFLEQPANYISEVSAPTHVLPVFTAAHMHCYLASLA